MRLTAILEHRLVRLNEWDDIVVGVESSVTNSDMLKWDDDNQLGRKGFHTARRLAVPNDDAPTLGKWLEDLPN